MMVPGRPNLLRLPLIDRYLAKSIAVPLLGSLILAAMLLVLDKMLRLFQYVVDAGGPVSVVWRMLANLLPEYLALGIPIGLMLMALIFRGVAFEFRHHGRQRGKRFWTIAFAGGSIAAAISQGFVLGGFIQGSDFLEGRFIGFPFD